MNLEIPLLISDSSILPSLLVGSLVGASLAALGVRVATSLFVSAALGLMLLTRQSDRWNFGQIISGLETSVFLVDKALLSLNTLWFVALLLGGELLRRILRAAKTGEGRSIPGLLGGYLLSPLSLASPEPRRKAREEAAEAARRHWLGHIVVPVAPSLPWVAAAAMVAGLTPASVLTHLWPLPVAALAGGLVLLRRREPGAGLDPSAFRVLVPALALVGPALLLEARDLSLCLLATGCLMNLLPLRRRAPALLTPRPDLTALGVMACALSSLSAFGDLVASGTREPLMAAAAKASADLGGSWILGAWALALALVGGSFTLSWFFLLPLAVAALPQAPAALLVVSACSFVGSRLSPVGLLREQATLAPFLRLAPPAALTLCLIWYLS